MPRELRERRRLHERRELRADHRRESVRSVHLARRQRRLPHRGSRTQHIVGGSTDDTRGCSPCTCGAATATCDKAQVTFFTDGMCGDGGESVPANGNCGGFPTPSGPPMATPPTYVAYEYSATVKNEGCTATPGVPDGGVTLTDQHTICCQ